MSYDKPRLYWASNKFRLRTWSETVWCKRQLEHTKTRSHNCNRGNTSLVFTANIGPTACRWSHTTLIRGGCHGHFHDSLGNYKSHCGAGPHKIQDDIYDDTLQPYKANLHHEEVILTEISSALTLHYNISVVWQLLNIHQKLSWGISMDQLMYWIALLYCSVTYYDILTDFVPQRNNSDDVIQ